jgi:L-aspartate oxidase
MNTIDTDVLIVGAGAAGLVAALEAQHRRVTIIAPGRERVPASAASELAQGGICAAVAPDDSPALHLEDTLRAGGASVHIEAARYLCERAPSAIDYLESLGMSFDRVEGRWSLHTEAAHSHARVLHVGDATGAAIMHAVQRAAVTAAHVDIMQGLWALQLLTNSGEVCGVLAVSEEEDIVLIRARDVVIATGGLGGLYARTTNPLTACGDGVAMALAAGARCTGLEFVQFHPTALNVDAHRLPLLTEALRGAGALLVDAQGKRIMSGVHPLGELAPRDVVARTVYEAQQHGSRVALDATGVDLDLEISFPTAYRACKEHGFDPKREPTPITPAAHYHMGGIAVDLNGRSSLPGLWAVGEAACTGVHGANRLASNSLLEAIVFGRRCGRVLSSEIARASREATMSGACNPEGTQNGAPRALREMMWRCMGVVRDASSLSQGITYIARLREQTPLDRVLERSRLLLVEHMLLAAARRTTNCGAHYRSDADATPALQRAYG